MSYLFNTMPNHVQPMPQADAETLGVVAADRVEQVLALRDGHMPTPLVALPGLAQALGIGAPVSYTHLTLPTICSV